MRPEELLELLFKALEGNPLLKVAIDGRCASGKSTFARTAAKELGFNVVCADHFFLPPHKRTLERMATPGGNIDSERFMQEVVLPLNRSETFTYRIFNCKSMDFAGSVTLPAQRPVLIEGAYCLHPMFGRYYDLAVFFDIQPAAQIARIEERNGIAGEFKEKWIPLEEAYFEAFSICSGCEYIVRS